MGTEKTDETETAGAGSGGLVCKNCGEMLLPHWELCPKCRMSVHHSGKCWNCGESLKETWKICPACCQEQQ